MSDSDQRVRLRRRLAFAGVLVFFLGVLFAFRAILLPFLVAILMTFVMEPVVGRLASRRIFRWRIPRWFAVLSVYLGFFVTLGVVGAYVGPKLAAEGERLIADAPKFFQRVKRDWIPEINEFLRGLRRRFAPETPEPPLRTWRTEFRQLADRVWKSVRKQPGGARGLARRARGSRNSVVVAHRRSDGSYDLRLRGASVEIADLGEGRYEVKLHPPGKRWDKEAADIDVEKALAARLHAFVDSFGARVVDYISVGQSLVTGIAGGLGLIALTFVIAAFLSIDLEAIHRFFRSLVPRGWHQDYDDLKEALDRGLSGVIRGQLVICLINGVLTAIGLYTLGVPYAGIWSLLAGAMSLIPIFGTVLSSAPMIGVSLFTAEPVGLLGLSGFGLALAVLGWILLIHFIEANILEPKIVGRHAKIHPVLILFALLAGQYLYGIAGLIFAVPALSIVQTVFLFVKDKLYGERPEDAAKGEAEAGS